MIRGGLKLLERDDPFMSARYGAVLHADAPAVERIADQLPDGRALPLATVLRGHALDVQGPGNLDGAPFVFLVPAKDLANLFGFVLPYPQQASPLVEFIAEDAVGVADEVAVLAFPQ